LLPGRGVRCGRRPVQDTAQLLANAGPGTADSDVAVPCRRAASEHGATGCCLLGRAGMTCARCRCVCAKERRGERKERERKKKWEPTYWPLLPNSQLAPFQDRSPFHSTHRLHRRRGAFGRNQHAIDRDRSRIRLVEGRRRGTAIGDRRLFISQESARRCPRGPARAGLLTRPSPRCPGRAPPWQMPPPHSKMRAAPSHPLVWVGT